MTESIGKKAEMTPDTENTKILQVRNLRFAFKGRPPVFDGLSFHFQQGEKIGITGPNGSGKSTLFLVLMGFLQPQEGEVEIFGSLRQTENDFAQIRTALGLVFQNSDHQLFSTSILEDAAFGPINLGHSPQEAEKIALREIARFGLAGLENRSPSHLSEGEKRRAALAGVMAMEPKALLLDEPFSGLDESSTGMLEEFLESKAPPFILIDHNRKRLEALCDRTLVLKKGKFDVIDS